MDVLKRRWRVVAVITLCALVASVGGLAIAPRTYVATVTLSVPAASTVGSDVQRDDLDYTDRLVNTYKRIGEGGALRARVLRALGLRGGIEAEVEPVPNTELMFLNVQAPTSELATRAGNAWANALVDQVKDGATRGQRESGRQIDQLLSRQEASLADLREEESTTTDPRRRARLAQQIRVREFRYESLAEQAAAQDLAARSRTTVAVANPAGPGESTVFGALPRAIALGLFVGILAGCGVALLLERRSPQLATLGEIEEAAGAPVLATIPLSPEPSTIFNGASSAQEAFGKVRAWLLSGDGAAAPCAILVTSLQEGDGKSIVALNLAAALARARRSVVLVDGDLRRPTLHRFFDLDNRRGLRDVLENRGLFDEEDLASLVSLIESTPVPDLSFLTSGEPSGDAAELLASPRMLEVIALLERVYDYIVIDSPAIVSASDAAAIAPHVDIVMVVVGKTPVNYDDLQTVRRQFDDIGVRNVGIIVNRWRDESVRPTTVMTT